MKVLYSENVESDISVLCHVLQAKGVWLVAWELKPMCDLGL